LAGRDFLRGTGVLPLWVDVKNQKVIAKGTGVKANDKRLAWNDQQDFEKRAGLR
jgi:hypothetical protein